MPIYLRRFYAQAISREIAEENKRIEAAQGNQSAGPSIEKPPVVRGGSSTK